jgi:hypothetical protein
MGNDVVPGQKALTIRTRKLQNMVPMFRPRGRVIFRRDEDNRFKTTYVNGCCVVLLK